MRLLALVLLLSACARDLDVAPEPAASDAPEALGELSGIYTLALAWTPPGTTDVVEIPLSATAVIVHLEKPGGGSEPVAGFVFDDTVDLAPALPTSADVEWDLLFSRVFGAALEGQHLDGQSRGRHMSGDRVPGGGALDLSLPQLGICPRRADTVRPDTPVRARRVCPFDPAVSGVYRGDAGDCDGGPTHATYLGLGFFENLAIGLRFPEEGEVTILGYDLFEGTASGFVVSPTTASFAEGQLSDDGSDLSLTMDVYDGARCLEHRNLRRLAGGERTSACAQTTFDLLTDLEFEARVVTEDAPIAGRFLDLRIYPTQSPSATLSPFLDELTVDVEPTEDVRIRRVPPGGVPAGQTARFAIEAPSGNAGDLSRYYEVRVVRRRAGATSDAYSVAPMRCLRDRI